jgi:putative SOS response-associated peptidase YedK
MCGRYARFTAAEVYARLFDAAGEPDVPTSYNVAPHQAVLAARARARGGRELVALEWGLVPFWARERKPGYSTINARAETVHTRPAFRQAFRSRRCLIAADGFFEWKRLERGKQPYFMRLRNGAPFAFAGIWDRWTGPAGDVAETCSIIVTDANEVVAPVHDRMPVILSPSDYDRWTDPGLRDPAPLLALLVPFPADAMEAYPVGTAVNNPRNDSPEITRPVAAEPP